MTYLASIASLLSYVCGTAGVSIPRGENTLLKSRLQWLDNRIKMILFLIAVMVLLWTLNDLVARVVTTFISIFLAAFAAFTVIPIFSRGCPYRSPTIRENPPE